MDGSLSTLLIWSSGTFLRDSTCCCLRLASSSICCCSNSSLKISHGHTGGLGSLGHLSPLSLVFS